jgi:hypothetical protein
VGYGEVGYGEVRYGEVGEEQEGERGGEGGDGEEGRLRMRMKVVGNGIEQCGTEMDVAIWCSEYSSYHATVAVTQKRRLFYETPLQVLTTD